MKRLREELPPRSPEVAREMNEYIALRRDSSNPVVRNLMRRAIRRIEDLELNNARLQRQVTELGGEP